MKVVLHFSWKCFWQAKKVLCSVPTIVVFNFEHHGSAQKRANEYLVRKLQAFYRMPPVVFIRREVTRKTVVFLSRTLAGYLGTYAHGYLTKWLWNVASVLKYTDRSPIRWPWDWRHLPLFGIVWRRNKRRKPKHHVQGTRARAQRSCVQFPFS